MATEVELHVIKQTQETLGTVIKKPALNEKLLKKPPFRFLHDIISNVVKTTGFMEGLYTASELNSETIKDKEGKIAFLQKAIDVVTMVTGDTLSVRPSKIVAGHEPERTNEFLQSLAKAVIGRMDSKQAVRAVLGKDKETKVKPNNKKAAAGNEIKKDKSNSDATKKEKVNRDTSKNGKANATRTRSTDRENTKNTNSTEKSKTNVKETSKKEKLKPTASTSNSSKDSSETPSKKQVKASPRQQQTKSEIQDKDTSSSREILPDLSKSEENSNLELPATDTIDSTSNSNSSPIIRPSTVSKMKRSKPLPEPDLASPEKEITDSQASNKRSEPNVTASTSENLQQRSTSSMRYVKSAVRTAKSARPTTARPAPPRIRNKNIVTDDETTRLVSAKEVSTVILDTQQQNDDDDEGFVVEDQIIVKEEEPITPLVESKASDLSEEEQKGSLVKDMLDTKKDLEGGSQQLQYKKVEIDKSQMKARDKELASREAEQLLSLRSFIQTVSRSANPLGKMLDYMQEDVDAMQQELRMWREERKQNLVALNREESITEFVLDPLRNQLEELEQAVQDQLDKINAMKATILHNDERIQRMLGRQHKISI